MDARWWHRRNRRYLLADRAKQVPKPQPMSAPILIRAQHLSRRKYPLNRRFHSPARKGSMREKARVRLARISRAGGWTRLRKRQKYFWQGASPPHCRPFLFICLTVEPVPVRCEEPSRSQPLTPHVAQRTAVPGSCGMACRSRRYI
jgi:hypothetical protein